MTYDITSGTQNPYVSVQRKCNIDLPRWMHWSSRAHCLSPSDIWFYHRLFSVGLHQGSRISMLSMNCKLGLSQLLLQIRWDRQDTVCITWGYHTEHLESAEFTMKNVSYALSKIYLRVHHTLKGNLTEEKSFVFARLLIWQFWFPTFAENRI
jgi:hypothetical protein